MNDTKTKLLGAATVCRGLAALGAFCAILLAGAAPCAAQTLTSFDPPGSTNTTVTYMNRVGQIAGTYSDSSGIFHGFVQNQDATFSSFDPRGSTYTYPTSINAHAEITGQYYDASGFSHGFLMYSTTWQNEWVWDGTFVNVDPPGSTYTAPMGINLNREITGYYYDSAGVSHGFLRTPDGVFTTFAPPRLDWYLCRGHR
jgi:hypothetical protein